MVTWYHIGIGVYRLGRYTLKQLLAWFHCRSGATAIEYGLMAGGISLTIVATVFLFGSDLNTIFVTLDSSFTANLASNAAG